MAATLVSPYGVDLWLFLARTVRLDRFQITEWQPLWTVSTVIWWPWLIAAALTGLAIAQRRVSVRSRWG